MPPRLAEKVSFRGRLQYILMATLLDMPFPISSLIIVDALCLIWTTVSLGFPVSWGGVPVWAWGVFFAATWTSFFFCMSVCTFFFGIVIGRRNYEYLKIFYYTKDIGIPIGAALASVLQMAVNLILTVGPVEEIVLSTTYRVTGVLLSFSVASVFVVLCARYSLSHIDQNSFWYILAVYFWKRLTLRVLLGSLRDSLEGQVSVRISEVGDNLELEKTSFLDGIVSDRRMVFCENRKLLSFGYNDALSKFLSNGLTLRRVVSGQGGDGIIMTGAQVARVDANLVKIAVRIALVFYRRIGKDLKESLTLDDLKPLPLTLSDREDVFRVLDLKHNGELTFHTIIQAILGVLRETTQLTALLSGKSGGGAVMKTIWGIVWYVVAGFISFGIFGLEFASLIAPVITFALAFTFIFGESIKRAWHAFIEVVVIRRFRIGDWVEFAGYRDFSVDGIDLMEVTGLDYKGCRVSIPTWKLWDTQLLNYNRSSYYKCRMYIQVDARLPKSTLTKIGNEILDWIKKRSEKYSPESFDFWEVADYFKNARLGWNELFDLRVKTICCNVNMPKLVHSEWSKCRMGQTAFFEAVRSIFVKHGATYNGLPDIYLVEGAEGEDSALPSGSVAVGRPKVGLAKDPTIDNIFVPPSERHKI